MKFAKHISLLLIIISCSGTQDVMEIGKTEERLTSVTIYMDYNLGSYEMLVPSLIENQYDLFQTYGGHGHGFEIIYSDKARLYFKNDWVVTSPNYPNYKSIGFELPNRNSSKDTIISGRLPDGTYWKEIIKDEDFIGYTNVTEELKLLFDKSIQTLNKIAPNTK